MAQAAYEHLLVDRRDDGVGIVTINRPNKLNVLGSQTRREIAAALRELDADPSIGSVILTGAGDRAFCAGQDLRETLDMDGEQATTWLDDWREMGMTIFGLSKAIVAAIHGHCVGGGMQLAANCDLRIAADNARMGVPEINDGFPCIVGSYVLWDLIGRGRTSDLVTTGRMIDAQEALAWGFVTRVVPRAELMDVALELARGLATKPRGAMRATKAWLAELYSPGWLNAREGVKRHTPATFASGEARQATADFLAHRREGRST